MLRDGMTDSIEDMKLDAVVSKFRWSGNLESRAEA